ncbi:MULTISPECIES: SDR family NAD(P)-dependent oxidoreductase [unclassified Microbacterium]|uniref:SDR family NAD(P)-dependent oxidoreductase n=1 Tax=unclassified Microbacterium TaxID=2609290 RepID=UPI00214B5399|nr:MULTISPECIES: SDR family NAD(P)-dependent oxidoreductase [unclassified Microbacterium]MCR2784216.1 SDR family NAD(P)-dependent oxidoreductase [Microbacterium sp. zg.B96]WIM14953.1 SDR family NAD(P)-dependent oxidoreductase [Microbacterium sp. zg-B96]
MPRTIVITGASDGIGAAAAGQLHDAGERVVVVGRDPGKTRAVAEPIGAPWHIADFSDLAQVRQLAADLLETYPRIDVLANNAGGIFGERTLTGDGFEITFQVNHLAPFLLTALLHPRLVESGASVIQTSSVAARRFARFDIDDLQAQRHYSASAAYGNAKLANVLFTKELQRRWGNEGVNAVAFHPGAVATSFAAASSGAWRFVYTNPVTKRLMTSAETGGSRLTWLALGTPGVDWQPGQYYERNRVARTSTLADDPMLGRALWERSAEMVGL